MNQSNRIKSKDSKSRQNYQIHTHQLIVDRKNIIPEIHHSQGQKTETSHTLQNHSVMTFLRYNNARNLMKPGIILAGTIFAVVLITSVAIPAYADPISPLKQFNMGVPLKMIQCSEDKILMESHSGKPYCLSESTAVKLVDRGFAKVLFMEEEIMFEEYFEKSDIVQTPSTIPATSLPITTNTEFQFTEELEQVKKDLFLRRGPPATLYSEFYPVYTDLQGATGASEVTLPFDANSTRIGYLPDGMVVKFILFDFDIPIDSQYWHPKPTNCDSFTYYIFPDYVDVNVMEIHSYFIEGNGGITIGIGDCTYENYPDNAKPAFETYEESVDWSFQKAISSGVEVRERSYLGVDYHITGKYDGSGGIASWQQNGLTYGVSSENYSVDLLEKVVQGMID